jgi:hypothetical protein
MTSLDRLFISQGFLFSRYVDDFRFFCSSYEEATNILYVIHEELGRPDHRLNLNAKKTSIVRGITFLQSEFLNPAVSEKREIGKKYTALSNVMIQQFNQFLAEVSDYPEEVEDEADLPPEWRNLAQETARSAVFVDLFRTALQLNEPDTSLLRHLLNRAVTLQITVLTDLVVMSLVRLSVLLPEVIRYLISCAQAITPRQHEYILSHLEGGAHSTNLYCKHWWRYFALKCVSHLSQEVNSRYIDATSISVNDKEIRTAAITSNIEIVRKYKGMWKILDDSELLTLIDASQILTPVERGVFKGILSNEGNHLQSAIAKSNL